MYVFNSNKGLDGNWGSEIFITNGRQQKKQPTNNTEHVTQKTTPWALAPVVCEKIFSTYSQLSHSDHFLKATTSHKRPLGK